MSVRDDAMIAFLPTDDSWCQQEFAHMTLVYAGEISEITEGDFSAFAKDMLSVSRVTGSFSLPVLAVEEFGEDMDAVDVLVFHPSPALMIARNFVMRWNKSEHVDYRPHATIGPAGSAFNIAQGYADGYRKKGLPQSLYFSKIVATWGDKKLIFNLNGDIY